MLLHIDGNHIEYSVEKGKSNIDGTVSRSGAICPCCGSAADFSYIRQAGMDGKLSSTLIAVVAEGTRGRVPESVKFGDF